MRWALHEAIDINRQSALVPSTHAPSTRPILPWQTLGQEHATSHILETDLPSHRNPFNDKAILRNLEEELNGLTRATTALTFDVNTRRNQMSRENFIYLQTNLNNNLSKYYEIESKTRSSIVTMYDKIEHYKSSYDQEIKIVTAEEQNIFNSLNAARMKFLQITTEHASEQIAQTRAQIINFRSQYLPNLPPPSLRRQGAHI